MSKLAFTRFFLRTRRRCGMAPLYTRRTGLGAHLMINSRIEVDVAVWRRAVASPAAWSRFSRGEGRGLCERLAGLSALITALLAASATTRGSLRVAVAAYAAGLPPQEAAGRGGSVMEALDTFICKAPSRTRRGRPLSPATLRHYRHLRSHLRRFLAGRDLTFEQLDEEFYHAYVTSALAAGLRLNTIGNHIKTLKTIIRGMPPSVRALADAFLRCEGLREPSDAIALTEAEVGAIASTPLPPGRLAEVRDLFVLMCWTGVRHSDLGALTHAAIITGHDGRRYFRVRAAKTGRVAVIPIFPVAEAILARYGGGRAMPAPGSNSRFNALLRRVIARVEACHSGGSLSHPFTRTFTDSHGSRATVTLTRADAIRCHTARRTFATMMTLRGNDPAAICAATGHTTQASLARYVKTDLPTRASRLR